MKHGTQVDQPLGLADESRQDIRSQSVDCKYEGQTVLGSDALWLVIVNAGVVNDPVEGTQRIHLLGDGVHLLNIGEVADHHGLRSGTAAKASSARRGLRACRTTRCPCSTKI